MKTIFAYLILGVLCAGIAGSSTYYFVNKKAADDKAALQTQIQNLTSQVNALNNKTAAVPTTSTATTPAAPAADSWKSYTNTDYKFSLMFGDSWQGYQVKKYVPTDGHALAYYYFDMPTTDPDYATASITTNAHTAVIFAVAVYTPSQWTAFQAEGGPIPDIVITANTNNAYVITYSHSQAYPPSLATNASDIKNVVSTFKNTP